MSGDIIKEIKKAELNAEKIIENAKKAAVSMEKIAKESMEREIETFKKESIVRLGKFKEEKKSFFKAEAEKLKKNATKTLSEYKKEIEEKTPKIKDKVFELVKRELCL